MNKSGYIIMSEGTHKVGLQAADGRVILPCIYDKILDYDDDGYIRVLKGEVYGTIDLEGNWAIPHSEGITHLGVFHQGTARARKGENWGLVDEEGKEVTAFAYKSINACYNNEYKATTLNGVYGTLTTDGQFTESKKQPKSKNKPRYQVVRTFRNDVAPAYTWDRKWIFVDRDLNRCSEYEYLSMDPVLRHGIYEVRNEHGYGVARYNGEPLIDEWYDHPVHFENGFAQCDKLFLNEEGKSVTLPGGQPKYLYGVLNDQGKYLFPLVYTSLHWNDYKKKDCWYAEDDTYSYLLYPDGHVRTYDKSKANKYASLPYIPESELENYIPQHELINRYEPKLIATKSFSCFDERWFDNVISQWTGTGWLSDHLEIFYRDTDAPIDVEKCYKKGMVLRAGSMLQVTKKLWRPVHKLRFYIASRKMYSKDTDNSELQRAFDELDFKEYFMHYNTCFVVMDVQKIKGKTQVVLLEIPHGVAALADKHNINLGNLVASADGKYELCFDAELDLESNIDAMVHGNSLSDYWNEAMYQPVGYTKDLKKVEYARQDHCEELSERAKEVFDYCHTIISKDDDREWKEGHFMRIQPNVIKIVVGDITRLSVDAVVNAANSSLLGGGGVDGAIHKAAGEELLKACKMHKGCRTGQSKITKAYHLPSKWIIHTMGPIWQGGKAHEDHLLASCYKSALRIATNRKLESLAFPCISTGVYEFPRARAASIALRTILRCMKKNHYKGDVIICCYTEEDAQIYIDCLDQMRDEPKVMMARGNDSKSTTSEDCCIYYGNYMDDIVVREDSQGNRYKKSSNHLKETGPCHKDDKEAFGGESFGYFHELKPISKEQYDNFGVTWLYNQDGLPEIKELKSDAVTPHQN